MRSKEHFTDDLISSIVIFIVAIPLCLGVAQACGAPLLSGILSGIIGGIVVGPLSGSPTSVSGPSASLPILALSSLTLLGSYESFLVAVVIMGVFQLLFSRLNVELLTHIIPSSVIKGMLTAVGLVLIFKQFPHLIGFDMDFFGDEAFAEKTGHNTITGIWYALKNAHFGAMFIGMLTLLVLLTIEKTHKKLPGGIIVIFGGIAINQLFQNFAPSFYLTSEHLVQLPLKALTNYSQFFFFPDWSILRDINVYKVAMTLFVISTLESLLSLEAGDKLDRNNRTSSPKKELIAQGIGNILGGLVGALPVSATIVRTSTNITAGARTKRSAILHGVWILVSLLLFPKVLNMIPLATLAAILIMVGLKLMQPAVIKDIYRKGKAQFAAYLITLFAIFFTDLLIGVLIGLAAGVVAMIYRNFYVAVVMAQRDNHYLISLGRDVSFLNKYPLKKCLSQIPQGSYLVLDARRVEYMDADILEMLEEYAQNSKSLGVVVEFQIPPHQEQRLSYLNELLSKGAVNGIV